MVLKSSTARHDSDLSFLTHCAGATRFRFDVSTFHVQCLQTLEWGCNSISDSPRTHVVLLAPRTALVSFRSRRRRHTVHRLSFPQQAWRQIVLAARARSSFDSAFTGRSSANSTGVLLHQSWRYWSFVRDLRTHQQARHLCSASCVLTRTATVAFRQGEACIPLTIDTHPVYVSRETHPRSGPAQPPHTQTD